MHNITVAHTKYLEKKSIEQVRKNTRYTVRNGKEGSDISLSKGDKDYMEGMFNEVCHFLNSWYNFGLAPQIELSIAGG